MGRGCQLLTLQGGHDPDVQTFGGSRQADRVRYARPGPWFAAEIWAYGANHAQFNTEWGRADFIPPRGWFLNLEPVMPEGEQRAIAETYISAFLETVLRGDRQYLPLFKDWRTGRHWLPETTYINRYRDALYVPLATFQEDADVASTTAKGGAISGESRRFGVKAGFRRGVAIADTTGCFSAGIALTHVRPRCMPSHYRKTPHAPGF